MKINPYIRLVLLIFIISAQFILLVTSVNNFFSLNSLNNSIKVEIGESSLQRDNNFFDIRQKLKDEFVRSNESEVLLRIKKEEMSVLKTNQQQTQEEIKKESQTKSNNVIIAR